MKKERRKIVMNLKVTRYYSNKISGICRFVEASSDDDFEQRRFVILNFHGIYSFEFRDDFNFLI